jgi:hypothetical protein
MFQITRQSPFSFWYLYVGGLISFVSTVIFLFTLDISGQNRFCVVAWYLSSIILHLEPTDAYRPHTVRIEMGEFSDVRFDQRVFIEFLNAEKVPPIEIHRRMQSVCGNQCVAVSTVKYWIRRFKYGELEQADLSDQTRSGKLWLQVITFIKIALKNGFCRKIIIQLWK